MFGWLRKRLQRPFPLDLWSVKFANGEIVTYDGQGAQMTIPASDLRKVVIATDDSGPWGADVMFLLYSSELNPVALFPLEAEGRDEFIAWLKTFPGFRGDEVRKAMGSTQVARFEIFNTEPNGS
jgi:hypothetical protein